MTAQSTINFDHPRQQALAAMRASLPSDEWHKNTSYAQSLRLAMGAHPVTRHPAIAWLNSGQLGQTALQKIHLEYRHAIVQIFTDALLAAQLQSRQLEPRLHPGAKMAPRCLLTLNVLDEFGFRPGRDAVGYYRANPSQAHYPLFEQVMEEYGISEQMRRDFTPSKPAQMVRQYLESHLDNYGISD
ncbi:MAG: hypothetical protein NWQ13_04800 [Glaciimonas sp.]|nr:hypothetical protein [Glaciimonas sp.]